MRKGRPNGVATNVEVGPSVRADCKDETTVVVAVVRICTELGGGAAD